MSPRLPRLLAAAATTTGRVRPTNEDRHLVDDRKGWFAIADGIGGLPYGERASECAIRGLRRESLREIAPPRALREVVADCHRAVRQLGAVLSPRTGIGTTLTVIRIDATGAELAHVGDSAAYLHPGRSLPLVRLTTDHTVAAPSVAVAGDVTQTFVAPPRLARYLGQPEALTCDQNPLRLAAGDRLLLCSDGVTRALDEVELATLSAAQASPETLARALVHIADLRGGIDNATALVIDLL